MYVDNYIYIHTSICKSYTFYVGHHHHRIAYNFDCAFIVFQVLFSNILETNLTANHSRSEKIQSITRKTICMNMYDNRTYIYTNIFLVICSDFL